MLTRTTEATVTFSNPFVLGDLNERLPAGDYTVETDEELIQGISFTAYRRVLIVFHIPPKRGEGGMGRAMTIDPDDLDAALKRDATGPSGSDARGSSRRDKPSEPMTTDERLDRTAKERAEFEGMEFNDPPL